jgi:hypothetical protein
MLFRLPTDTRIRRRAHPELPSVIRRAVIAFLSGLPLIAALALPSQAEAALEFVGICPDGPAGGPRNTACVVTDGTFEYLTFGGARVRPDALQTLLDQGWELGTRSEFAELVARNAPIFTSDWNDATVARGAVFSPASGALLQQEFASLAQARTGDVGIAKAFTDIILMLGGQDGNPSYSITLGTADLDASGLNRYTVTLSAYLTDQDTSLTRNNLFSGPASTATRTLASEVNRSTYFLMRSPAPIPEPGPFVLLGVGLAALLVVRRRLR